jgi:hypothetical protein
MRFFWQNTPETRDFMQGILIIFAANKATTQNLE